MVRGMFDVSKDLELARKAGSRRGRHHSPKAVHRSQSGSGSPEATGQGWESMYFEHHGQLLEIFGAFSSEDWRRGIGSRVPFRSVQPVRTAQSDAS
jgi:hypothetical protein